MDGIAWAASAMSAAQTRLEIAAQNLANGSTDGFRRSIARGWLRARGVSVESVRDGEQGALRRTGRTLDRAIVGDGAFVLRAAGGSTIETRSGAFTRDRFGTLRDDLGRTLVSTRLARGSYVRGGFLESSNVDAAGEMVNVLEAERSFEAAQKVLTAIDQTAQRASSKMSEFK
ncbi:MAG TPA: flagellar basal body rod C-terminal domain-containing protein [Candidatus Rubrimentiphilum sp.]|nr:flagellar basal body rod C-terminal domain-containing protein [Candidatus Rubrimentiphilum sp.]